MSWFHLCLDTPQDWKNSSELEDWVPIYKKILIRRFGSVYNKWTVKWIQYLFYGSLYMKRRKSWCCTNDVRLNRLWTFNIGICKHQGRFLVYGYCRRIKYIYNFLTISCVLNCRINSLGVNNSRIIFNTNRIIRLLRWRRCFLRGYLTWWIVRWRVKLNESQEL